MARKNGDGRAGEADANACQPRQCRRKRTRDHIQRNGGSTVQRWNQTAVTKGKRGGYRPRKNGPVTRYVRDPSDGSLVAVPEPQVPVSATGRRLHRKKVVP